MPRVSRSTILTSIVTCAVVCPSAVGKPKKKDWPSDLNAASLRVAAMQMLYELDASPEQLRAVKEAGVADPAERPPVKGPEPLVKAVRGLRDALLAQPGDDAKISAARNAVADAAADVDPPLADQVRPTAGAKANTAAVVRQFSAGQVAGYLAAHADQVAGPAERLVSGLTEAGEGTPAEADGAVKRIAAEAAELAVGDDPGRAAPLAAKAADWLRANAAAGAPSSAADRAKLEASARAAIGDPPPVESLGHWFDAEVATLLSNPQLPEAVDALLDAQPKPK